MEFFHTVLLSLCFIKGCDLIVRSFCMSRAAIWNWYNASSDIGIIICATWQYSASAQEDEEIYYSVCVEVFVFFFSFRVLGVRGDLIQNAENYCYELSVFFFLKKDFTSIVIHHLILLISSAVKCMQTVRRWNMNRKLYEPLLVYEKKSKPPFFVMQSYHHRVSLLSRACLDFIDYQLLWWHYWFFFLYTDCVCACICVSCSVFCFSSPSTTANELINITSSKKISYFNIYF